MRKLITAVLASMLMAVSTVSVYSVSEESSLPISDSSTADSSSTDSSDNDSSSDSSDSQAEKKDIKNCTFTLSSSEYTYNGKPHTPSVIVKDGGNVLTKGIDYTVSYANNINIGKGFLIVSGTGEYCGITPLTFTIKRSQIQIKSATVTISKSTYEFGKEITPVPTVKLNGKTLIKGTDYTVSYSNNKLVGTAQITITGKGLYTGTVSKSFTIIPAKQEIQKIESEYKGFFVDWVKKGSATGYQLQYSSDSNFNKTTTLVISNNVTDKKSVTNLVAGKKYFVKVRSYTISNGRYYYGPWSAVTSVTTDKVNRYPANTIIKSYTSKTDKITLNWNKVTNANGYRLYQKINGSWKTIKVINSADITSFTVTGLTAGTDYQFTIRAYKTIDKTKYLSKSYTAKATATSSPKVKFSTTATTQNSIELNWGKVNATGYRVYKKVSGEWVRLVDIASSNITTYKVTGLVKTSSYDFCIRAYKRDSANVYNAGALTYITVKTNSIKAPEKITTTLNTGSVQLKWSDSDNSDYYEIYRLDGESWTKLGKTTEKSYIDIRLSPATKYTYKITEIKGAEVTSTNPLTATTADIPDKATAEHNRDLWVGDSRTVHLSKYQNIQTVAMSGKGYNYLMEHIDEICSYTNCNIILNFGVNDLRNLEGYIEAYNQIYERTKDTCTVYFMTINPCCDDYAYRTETILNFNSTMKAMLNPEIKIIDSYTCLDKTGYVSPDGLHYDMDTYTKIYNYALSVIHR